MNAPNPTPTPQPPSPGDQGWVPWVLVVLTLLVLNFCWLSFL